jgi:hypothetical protein
MLGNLYVSDGHMVSIGSHIPPSVRGSSERRRRRRRIRVADEEEPVMMGGWDHGGWTGE